MIRLKMVLITGPGAVGKMTVGQALSSITGMPLMHNHIAIEPVLEVFGYFNKSVVHDIRRVILKEIQECNYDGVICTLIIAYEDTDWEESISDTLAFLNITEDDLYYVELYADVDVRLDRNSSENRLSYKMSKRNIAQSTARLLEEETVRTTSLPGEIKYRHYIKIDNTNISPEEVAQIIVNAFKL